MSAELEVVHNVPEVHTEMTVLAFSSTLRRMLVNGFSSASSDSLVVASPLTAATVACRCWS